MIAYYSPLREFGRKESLQAFTALAVVKQGQPYQGGMEGGFKPLPRDADRFEARLAPTRPLLGQLSFTKGQTIWGFRFRFGLFEVNGMEMAIIAQAMGVETV